MAETLTTAKARMPKAFPFLVWNEGAERFTYYGMKTILTVFMTKYLLDATGNPAPLTEAEGKTVFHLFAFANYAFPVLGSILADVLIGKYLTVISLSLLYCVGCLFMAFDQTRLGLWVGLGLIALGSGGIKPCMVAILGDQFTKETEHLLGRAVRYFYMAIQAGGLVSTLLTPVLLDKYGPKVAFGVPAVFMLCATFLFWLGRNYYIKVPANAAVFKAEITNRENLKVMGGIAGFLLFMTAFFALYDQNGSSWVLQAEKMDRHFLGIEWLSSQLQAVNPIIVLLLVPLFEKWIYPACGKLIKLTALRKMSVGMFLMVPTFLLTALIQGWIDAGETPNIAWQLLAWLILTTAEVLAYATGLEFFYTQAPKRLKSIIQGLFMLAVALGNLFTAAVNWCIENVGLQLAGAAYFNFFAGFMFLMSAAFVIAAVFYKEKSYVG